MLLIKLIIIFLPTMVALGWVIYDVLYDNLLEITERIFSIFLGVVINCLYIFLLLLVFARCVSEVVSQNNVRYNLVSTKFNNAIEGKFYLGRGNVDTTEYMYYTVRIGDEIQRKKTDNYKIYISNEEPYVLIQENTVNKGFKNWLFNIEDINEVTEEGQSIFYIPENSIIEDININ